MDQKTPETNLTSGSNLLTSGLGKLESFREDESLLLQSYDYDDGDLFLGALCAAFELHPEIICAIANRDRIEYPSAANLKNYIQAIVAGDFDRCDPVEEIIDALHQQSDREGFKYNFSDRVCKLLFEHFKVVTQKYGSIVKYYEAVSSRLYQEPTFIAKWLINVAKFSLTSTVFEIATNCGDIDLLKWLDSKGCEKDYRAYEHPAKKGDLEIIKWLFNNHVTPSDRWATLYAARGGHFEVLKWMETKSFLLDNIVCEAAAEIGRLDILEWAVDHGCSLSAHTFSEAARNGNLEMLKWLNTRKCPWDHNAPIRAAGNGHLETLKWLRTCKKYGPPYAKYFTGDACMAAARAGHLHVLKWFKGKLKFGSCLIATAAESGHLDAIIWLRELTPPCPWDASAPIEAARYGQFRVLKWLIKKGCPFDHLETCSAAASCGRLTILKWLFTLKVPSNYRPIYQAALSRDNAAVALWMRVKGFTV